MEWIAVGLMGCLLGLLGGGGGILAVPILVSFFGFAATEATGASLFIVGSTSLIGSITALAKKQVQVKQTAGLAAGAIAGAFTARSWLVPMLPPMIAGLSKDKFTLIVFAFTLFIVAARMFAQPKTVERSVNVGFALLVGFAIGLYSGFLGAGGGFLLVPAMTLVLGLPLRAAVPSSLFVITLQSLAGFAGELGKDMKWQTLLSVTGVAAMGMVLGILLRPRVPEKQLRFGFAALLVLIGCLMLIKSL